MKVISDPTRNVELLTWVNKETGVKRIEHMIPVKIDDCDCHNLYLDETGNFYTNGVIGWMQMNKYINK